jgi:hypothetical protein
VKKLTLGLLLISVALAAPTGINTNQIRTAQPNAIDLAAPSVAEGNSLGVARSDHTHSITGVLPQLHGGTGSASVACGAGQVLTSDGTTYTCVSAGLTTYARASVPACDGSKISSEIVVHDAGQPDETWVCELTAAAAYMWTVYAQVPNSTVQVMSGSGMQFVTVGGTFTPAYMNGQVFCSVSLTSTQAGPATSSGCRRDTPDYCGAGCTGSFKIGAMYLAVGATSRFTRVRLELSGTPWPMLQPCVGSTPASCTANITSGQRVMQYGSPYAYASWPVAWSSGGSGASLQIGVLWDTYGSVYSVQVASPYNKVFQTNQFVRSGDLKISLDAAARNAWLPGWNASLGPAPTGVNAASYYWMVYTWDGAYGTPWTSTVNAPWTYGAGWGAWEAEAQAPVTNYTVRAAGVWDD